MPELSAFDNMRHVGLGEPALPLPSNVLGTGSSRLHEPALLFDEEAVAEDEDDEGDATLSLQQSPPSEASVPSSSGLKLVYSPRLSFDASKSNTPSHSPPLGRRHTRTKDDGAKELHSASAALAIPSSSTVGRVGFSDLVQMHEAYPPASTAETTEDERTEYDSWTGSTSDTGTESSGDESYSGDGASQADVGDDEDEDSGAKEEEYEVDMGALQDKLAQGGGGEVSIRRDENRASDFKSRLVGGDGRTSSTVPLEPFRHQVGGHSHIFRFSKKAVCKVRLLALHLLGPRHSLMLDSHAASHLARESVLRGTRAGHAAPARIRTAVPRRSQRHLPPRTLRHAESGRRAQPARVRRARRRSPFAAALVAGRYGRFISCSSGLPAESRS